MDLSQWGLTKDEQAEALRSGLKDGEIAEACHLFNIRLANRKGSSKTKALVIEDVDIALRQLRLFLPIQCLWAWFEEVDKNVNGQVDILEFILMVAKLRGRSTMSQKFYLNSLSRSVKARFTKVFEILSDQSKLLCKDDMITSSRQLHSHIDTDSEEFKRALEELNPSATAKYTLTDFLMLQAQLRKPPPEIDVALMSLTDEEYNRFADFFKEWRKVSMVNTSPMELRAVLHQLGHAMSVDQARRVMQSAELDGSRPVSLEEFLYILVSLGAGTNDKPRRILLPGASYQEAFDFGLPLEELYELGYEDLAQIRQAGWSAQSVVRAGFGEPWKLRQVGYTAGELRKIGWSAKNLKLAGFSLEELRNAGFSSAALRDCVSVLSRNRAHRANEESALSLRAPEHVPPGPHPFGNVYDTGLQFGEKRWWATPRIKTMLDGRPGTERPMSTWSTSPKKSCLRVRPVTR